MRSFWISAILILLAIPIIPFALFGDAVEVSLLDHPSSYYIFFVGILLLGSDIIAPLPSSLIAVFIGTKLGFLYGSISIFIGLSLGSLIGFGLGWYPGNALVQKWLPAEKKNSLQMFESRISYWVLIISRSIPILAESTVIAA